MSFHRSGHFAQAQALYARILAQQPRHFDALHLSGVLAAQTGDPRKALRSIGKALEVDPRNAPAHCNLGSALKDLGRLAPALASYDQAIALQPSFAEAHASRAMVLADLQQLDSALASCNAAIAIRPTYAEAHCTRGIVLGQLGQLDAALASLNCAIQMRPDYPEAHSNQALVLTELNQLDAALRACDRALQLKPDYAEAHSNRGNILRQLGELDAALASYERAVSIRPDYADARYNRSTTLLLCGDFARGWADYEWRWKVRHGVYRLQDRGFQQPLWLGRQVLTGKTILLHSEQGLGDTLQFCRYAPLLAARGARVVLEVQKPLLSVLAGLDGVSQLVERGCPLPAFDYHCPLMSLPLALGTAADSIPAPLGYLRSEDSEVAAWQLRLRADPRPCVGLVWSGNSLNKHDSQRSIPLSLLVEYLPRCCRYVSLQKDVREADEATLRAHPELFDLSNRVDQGSDFSDTAALCTCMQVVISVDTSVAHLSAALSRKTWIMLPRYPDWRWMLDRDDSPWYPSAKLYRQDHAGDWRGVLARLRTDLAQEIQGTSRQD